MNKLLLTPYQVLTTEQRNKYPEGQLGEAMSSLGLNTGVWMRAQDRTMDEGSLTGVWIAERQLSSVWVLTQKLHPYSSLHACRGFYTQGDRLSPTGIPVTQFLSIAVTYSLHNLAESVNF